MTKDEALQMCLEYIETDAHERKYVRHAIKEALAQPEHHALQAQGKHPAPCARHCEAQAFQIVIRNLKGQIKAQPARSGCTAGKDEECTNRHCATKCPAMEAHPEQEPVAYCYVQKSTSVDILTFDNEPDDAVNGTIFPLFTTPPKREWVGFMRGVRVAGDMVIILVKGGNDAARELCGALIREMKS